MANEKSNTSGHKPISSRRHDLDDLRTSLSELVIVHHTSMMYGGVGGWPYQSSFYRASVPLVGLNAFNQSFFMGLFFWVSGRVSAQSLAKTKTRAASSSSSPSSSSAPAPPKATITSFLRNKAIRLGIPAVTYTVAVAPLVRVAALPSWDRESVTASLTTTFGSLRHVLGPLWYPATLLAFDCVAAGAYPFVSAALSSPDSDDSKKSKSKMKKKTYRAICRWGWLGVAACTFLFRLQWRIGYTAAVVGVQSGFLAQYLSAYAAGFASSDALVGEPRMVGVLDSAEPPILNDDGDDASGLSSSSSSPTKYLMKATALSLLTFPIVFIPRILDTPDLGLRSRLLVAQVAGGWNLPAALYALWGEFSFALVGPALMEFYYRRSRGHGGGGDGRGREGQGKKNKKEGRTEEKKASFSLFPSEVVNARLSYAAFLMHTPFSVGTGIFVDWALSRCLSSGFGLGGIAAGSESLGEGTTKVVSLMWQALGPLVMTGVMSWVNIYGSFFVGKKLLEWIPGLGNII